jgi:arsenate reductase (glutaredoxin)
VGEATFYSNPACSKCRTVSGILAERGVEADVVEYLQAPPDRAALERLLRLLGTDDPGAIVRRDEPAYAELGLEGAGRDALLDAIAAHPELLQRPIVVVGDRAVVARPPERVLELLE